MERARRIIALETSGRHGSVAILCGEDDEARLLKQTTLSDDQRTAQALAPALRELLKDADWSPQSIGLVAVAVGPGSFTGLRIGVTTAKTFAYAVGAEIVGVNTLAAIAAQAPAPPSPLWAILDAQRQELFAARFTSDAQGTLANHCITSIVSQEAWLSGLRPGDCVTGPAMRRLIARLPQGVELVPEEFWEPMATTVGLLAWNAYQAGKCDDVWKLAPNYYRLSAAEEKRKT